LEKIPKKLSGKNFFKKSKVGPPHRRGSRERNVYRIL
jgi:hypothetical protein